ncbi:MAG: TetR family transcriptional regulator, partial [Paenibacillus sp. RIFOXYA1_FULL_44_5]
MASQKKEKYHQILQGALKVFADNGFHRAQVSKIAKEAGVADGTIYLYFKNKEDILICLFQEVLGDLLDNIRSQIKPEDSAMEAIQKVCEIHYSVLENHVDLAYVTQIELRQSSMELRKEIGNSVRPYIKFIESLLIQGMEEKLFRPDLDVKLTRSLLFGGMDEVVTSWLISGRKYSL